MRFFEYPYLVVLDQKEILNFVGKWNTIKLLISEWFRINHFSGEDDMEPAEYAVAFNATGASYERIPASTMAAGRE